MKEGHDNIQPMEKKMKKIMLIATAFSLAIGGGMLGFFQTQTAGAQAAELDTQVSEPNMIRKGTGMIRTATFAAG